MHGEIFTASEPLACGAEQLRTEPNPSVHTRLEIAMLRAPEIHAQAEQRGGDKANTWGNRAGRRARLQTALKILLGACACVITSAHATEASPRCTPRMNELASFADDIGWIFWDPEDIRATICPGVAFVPSDAPRNALSSNQDQRCQHASCR